MRFDRPSKAVPAWTIVLESEAELERFRALLEGTKTEMCAVRYADGSVPLEPQSDYAYLTRAELAEIGLTRFIVDTNTGEQCESDAKPQERVIEPRRLCCMCDLPDIPADEWDAHVAWCDEITRKANERRQSKAAPEPPSSDAPPEPNSEQQKHAALLAFARDILDEWWERGYDSAEIQGIAVHHGLLEAYNAPPNNDCDCENAKAHECYRFSASLQ